MSNTIIHYQKNIIIRNIIIILIIILLKYFQFRIWNKIFIICENFNLYIFVTYIFQIIIFKISYNTEILVNIYY